MCLKDFPVAAMLRVSSRGETRSSPQAVAEGVSGPLRILPKRAGPCAAWLSGETLRRCGKIRGGRAGGCRGRARGEAWALVELWMTAMREDNPNGAIDTMQTLLLPLPDRLEAKQSSESTANR